MSGIIGIGACVADTLITVPRFPAEDTKLRAVSTKRSGGGPVATGLVAAAKLGAQTAFAGILADDADGRFLLEDFRKYNVNTDAVEVVGGYRSFVSCIWLNSERGTRTCVFDKGDLPALTLSDRQKQAVAAAKLLMVDGNELDAAVEAAKIIRAAGGQVLYDAGGLYDGVERLLPLADLLIPSEEFALGITGKATAEDAATELFERYHPQAVVITQGSRGGLMYDGGLITRYPVYPADVVDSNGAGDVFHGAFAAGVMRGLTYIQCCHFASAVSALKCCGTGARESVPDYDTAVNFLRRNGYEL